MCVDTEIVHAVVAGIPATIAACAEHAHATSRIVLADGGALDLSADDVDVPRALDKLARLLADAKQVAAWSQMAPEATPLLVGYSLVSPGASVDNPTEAMRSEARALVFHALMTGGGNVGPLVSRANALLLGFGPRGGSAASKKRAEAAYTELLFEGLRNGVSIVKLQSWYNRGHP